MKIKVLLKLLFGSMALFMIYLATVTSMKSNMFSLSPQVLHEPWFQTTLVDFYFLVTIISVWVIYKEKSIWTAILWIVVFICLGSIGVNSYIFIQLMGLKEDEGLEKLLLKKSS
jgi:hypothetical protein